MTLKSSMAARPDFFMIPTHIVLDLLAILPPCSITRSQLFKVVGAQKGKKNDRT